MGPNQFIRLGAKRGRDVGHRASFATTTVD